MAKHTLVSIIVPFHSEEGNLPLLHKALHDIMGTLPEYNWELILIDDGSTDGSAAVVKQLAAADSRIRLLEFSRNFGKEAAVSAGLHTCRGDAAIIMDADMQHPPALIPELIKKWQQGAEVVIGVRDHYKKQGFIKKVGSAWFYRIMRRIAHTQITPHATDFRLLDACVIKEFNKLTERNRITRGMLDWMGFKRDYVSFIAPARHHGEASYTISKLIALAVNSFTSYSMLPLRIAGYLGIVILTVSIPLLSFILVNKYLFDDPWHLNFSGPAILAIALLFLVGVILTCLGLISMYIAHIHAEVINRPLYIVRDEKIYTQNTEGQEA